MIFSIAFRNPITEPVYIFLVLLLVVFFAPKILRLIKIPGIVGFILAGVALGPNGFNVIGQSSGIELFSTIGLLYIMFLIGLEIDLADFQTNRFRSFIFGGFTFLVPLVLGFVVCRYLLGLPFLPSILLASMFSTHTMISYPIVSRLGLNRHRTVNIVAGGTMITDTAVLLLLAVIVNSSGQQVDSYFWLQMAVSLSLLLFTLFWLIPRISKWLFRKLEADAGGQYLLLLLVLFISAYLSKAAGIEPMIGAFLAGIAMNGQVPPVSSLMNRTKFIGNTLFIPVFLISVGMVVDLRVFLQGYKALEIAGILVVTALVSKYLAAWFSQLLFRFNPTERNLMFGLSASHAAATIALVMVGFNLGMLDLNMLNGTVAVIFISCMVSSFVTQNAGRKLAISDHVATASEHIPQRILIPLSNPATMRQLLNLAAFIKDPAAAEPLYPLSVIIGDIDSPAAQEQLLRVNKTVSDLIRESDRSGIRYFPATRVDVNVANGINRAIKELLITHVVLGWNGKTSTLNYIFGTLLEGILPRNNQLMALAKLDSPLNSVKRILLVLPPNVHLETGFNDMIAAVMNLTRQVFARLTIVTNAAGRARLNTAIIGLHEGLHIDFVEQYELRDISELDTLIRHHDLSIYAAARPRTLSYCSYIAHLPRVLSRNYSDTDFIILYPQQSADLGHSAEPVGNDRPTILAPPTNADGFEYGDSEDTPTSQT